MRVAWRALLGDPGSAPPLAFERVPFDHPLYILFSSGTTGLPKAIVHGTGGILLEHLKALALHTDLGPEDRFCWYTTTGWMMWNYLVSGLAVGSTLVLFDGNPAWPDLRTLWRLASDERVTYLGLAAPFLMACRAAGLAPGEDRALDLEPLRGVGSTGAPLPAAGFHWVADAVKPGIPVGSLSGGTDLCTGFLGPSPLVPVWAGEISCRMLGARVEAFDDDGRAVLGRQGELVITAPMPSMPVAFWRDEDGQRMRAAYFERFPGVWRHGDWLTITDRGSCVVTGRSDATLNRGGVRLGTAEFYAVVEALPGIADSLVVHLEDESRRVRRAAAVRRAAGRRGARRGAPDVDRPRAPRRAVAAPRPRCDPRRCRRSRGRCRARSSRSRSSGSCSARTPTRRHRRTRSPIPRSLEPFEALAAGRRRASQSASAAAAVQQSRKLV